MEQQQVKVVCIRNPFDPVGSRELRDLPYDPFITARGYTAQFFPAYKDIPFDGTIPLLDLVISVNGTILTEDSDRIILPNDSIVFCAVPRGEGKDFLSILGMLAVMLISIPIGGWLGGVLGPSLGILAETKGMTMLVAGLTGLTAIGGASLINAFIPPPVAPLSSKPMEVSPTYGWQAAGNPFTPGGALPTIYGTHMVVPTKMCQYLHTEGQNQYLNMLMVIAGHEIDSVTDIRINEQSIDLYTDVEVATYFGTGEPPEIMWFSDMRNDVPIGAALSTDWTVRQTTTDVDGFGLGLIAPMGLWHAEDDGSIGPNIVLVETQYRKVGDVDWIDWMREGYIYEGWPWQRHSTNIVRLQGYFPLFFKKYQPGTTLRFEKGVDVITATVVSSSYEEGATAHTTYSWSWTDVVCDGPIPDNDYKLYRQNADYLEGAQTSPMRWFYTVESPPGGYGQYEVRARYTALPKKTARYGWEIWMDYQQEIVKESVSYPNTAMIAIRALATDQLSGYMPLIDCVVTRSEVPVWTGAAYEYLPATSPAWACYDMLHDSLNGGGVPYSRIIYDAFDEWDTFCTEKGLTCNIVFDTTMTLKQAMDTVGMLGRGQVVQMGTSFTCLVEKPEEPVQRFLFGPGNIKAGSLGKEWLASDDRADEVEITYWDPDNHYAQTPIVVQQVGFDDVAAVPKTISIMYYGCTSRDMAASFGRFLLNKNKYLTLTCTWEADVDALGCVVGDVVDIGHDLTDWGASGRVVSATASTVVLDREVTLEASDTYIIDIKHNDDTRETRTLTVDTATTTDTLTVSPDWTTTPQRFEIYAFGTQDRHIQPVWVMGIERSGDMKARLIGLEYMEEVFDDDEIIPVIPPPAPGQILGLTATEAWAVGPDGSARAVIDLSWRCSEGLSWNVYIRVYNASPMPWDVNSWSTVGTTSNTIYRIEWNLTLHETYEVAVSRTGPEGGATALVTITGKGWLPSNITNVVATTVSTGILISWELILEIDVREYILKEGADWDSGTEIYRGLSSNYLWRITVADAYDFWVKAVDTSGNECDIPGYVRHYIEIPEAVTLAFAFVGNSMTLYWSPSSGDFPIIEYLITYGDSYAESVETARTKGTTWTTQVLWTGNRRFWVTAIDAAGNLGHSASVDAIATAPSAVRDINPQVVHNNVLLRWTEPEFHTLPIASYLLKKGDFIESAELLGELFATFAAQQEIEAGTYRYWLAAKDTAGTVGVYSSVTVKVTAPIGYILRYNSALDLSAPDDADSFVVVEHSGAMLMPVIRGETWEDHHLDNEWATPDEQIDEGYFLYAHPANPAGGYWEQVIDMGVDLPGSRVALVTDVTVRDGAPDYNFTILTSLNGVDYTEYGGLLEFYSDPFRYVKVRVEVNIP